MVTGLFAGHNEPVPQVMKQVVNLSCHFSTPPKKWLAPQPAEQADTPTYQQGSPDFTSNKNDINPKIHSGFPTFCNTFNCALLCCTQLLGVQQTSSLPQSMNLFKAGLVRVCQSALLLR